MKLLINNIPIEFEECQIIEKIEKSIRNSKKGYICTINANLLSEAYKNISYREVLQNSLINICDGSVLAKSIGWIYKKKVKAWPGPDFFIETIKNKEFSHFFLGSNNETLKGLKENLILKTHQINDSRFLPLPYKSVNDFDYQAIANEINKYSPDIIWLSLGAPKQEIFASKLLRYLNCGIIACVGAAFDFYSKTGNRAPLFIRNLNLEWLWRVTLSPHKTLKRLKREIIILPRILLQERKRIKNFK